MTRRPPRAEWLAYVPWRSWFRQPALLLSVIGALGGLALALFGLIQTAGLVATNASDPAVLILAGVLLAASGPTLWAVLLSGELIIARAGLFLGFQFIPWREVSDVRDDPAYLSVITPSVRAYWNSWTGALRIPKFLFEVPPDLGERLRSWAHQGVNLGPH